MDGQRFDAVGKWLASCDSRRTTLRGLAVGALAIGLRRLSGGYLMRTMVVALVIMIGLTAIPGQGSIRPRDAAAHEPSGAITLANYGAATVDGVFTDGEYGDGCFFPPSQSVGDTTYHFTLCETNDDVNDFYAFLIDDLTLPAVGDPAGLDGVNIVFDDEHDGSIACPHAQDAIGAASEPNPAIIDMFYCGAFDSFSGDSVVDGSAAFTFSPDVGYVFEVAHPLNSGDAADYALALHDTVGFCAVYLDAANNAGEVQFPKNCFGDGERYGDVYKKGKYDDILAKLRGLVDSCEPCPPGVLRPLQEDLDLAIRQYTQNDGAAAAQTLEALVAKVDRGMQSGMLPEAIGRQLTAEAMPLIEKLSGAQAEAKKGHDSGAKAKKEAQKADDSRHRGKKVHHSQHGGKNEHRRSR